MRGIEGVRQIGGPLAGRTVLLLLPQAATLDAVTSGLERAGASVIATRTYQDALPRAVLERIDALVCDAACDDLRDGLELVRTLREIAEIEPHLRRLRTLALGEIAEGRRWAVAGLLDERLERTAAPAVIVMRLGALLAGPRSVRPAA